MLAALQIILQQLKTCKMKSKIPAVIFFTATSIFLISCDWLFGKKNDNLKPLSIKGKWVIENVIDSSSTQKNGLGLLAFSMLSKDSVVSTADFVNDSLLVVDKDPISYHLDSSIATIFVKDDTATLALKIKLHTDSSMLLYATADSLYYLLKRK